MNRTLSAAVAMVALAAALLAAGCGGSASPGVASIGGRSTNAVSAPKQSWAAAYHCYATHGYPDYRPVAAPSVPSAPPISGWWKLPGKGRFGVSPAYVKKYSSPQFRAVDKVCGPLIPHKMLTPAQVAASVAYARKVAECMRAHGMPDLPDPDSSGLIHLQSSAEDNTPRFLSAESACRSVMTGFEPFLIHMG